MSPDGQNRKNINEMAQNSMYSKLNQALQKDFSQKLD
jgi:hypothetical protein